MSTPGRLQRHTFEREERTIIKLISAVGGIGAFGVMLFAGATHDRGAEAAVAPGGVIASVEVLEKGETKWRPLVPNGATPAPRGCWINFRGKNSSDRKIWIAWSGSQARTKSGWWATFNKFFPDTPIGPNGGLLRETHQVKTACRAQRRYRIALKYDANRNGVYNGIMSGDLYSKLYLPSGNSFYPGGTTTVNVGDVYAPFK